MIPVEIITRSAQDLSSPLTRIPQGRKRVGMLSLVRHPTITPKCGVLRYLHLQLMATRSFIRPARSSSVMKFLLAALARNILRGS